jgi:hypothetical protein
MAKCLTSHHAGCECHEAAWANKLSEAQAAYRILSNTEEMLRESLRSQLNMALNAFRYIKKHGPYEPECCEIAEAVLAGTWVEPRE